MNERELRAWVAKNGNPKGRSTCTSCGKKIQMRPSVLMGTSIFQCNDCIQKELAKAIKGMEEAKSQSVIIDDTPSPQTEQEVAEKQELARKQALSVVEKRRHPIPTIPKCYKSHPKKESTCPIKKLKVLP